jgi:hypothetical protein
VTNQSHQSRWAWGREGVARPAAMKLLALILMLSTATACRNDPDPKPLGPVAQQEPKTASPEREAGDSETGDTGETGDPLSGEAAHIIPFADRTSMGYLLLLPPGTKNPEPPSRAYLKTLVEQAFPERRDAGEYDLLLTLISTSPHETGFDGEIQAPSLQPDGENGEMVETVETGKPDETGKTAPLTEAEQAAAKAERSRTFDVIGLHIELLHLGLGEAATIPSSALADPILTRELDEQQRKSLLGREYALLLRADYRNQSAVRGLRLHQTLVRVVAEHYQALIHDPDTLETMDIEAFTERRLRVEAGNVADQIVVVPFSDPHDDNLLRMSSRGMRRFGAVDIELDGLPRDPVVLQQASDLIAGLALVLAREAEVDISGFAVVVPETIELDCAMIKQTYAARSSVPACASAIELHLVERAPEPHDPRDHVVARIVAPREQSDAPNYDHPQWVRAALAQLFPPVPSPPPI